MKDINFVSKVIINIYSVFILVIIFSQYISKDKNRPITHKIFMGIIQSAIVMLILDILSRFDGSVGMIYIMINHVSNFLIFSLNLLIASLWLLYVHYHIFIDIRRNKRLLHSLIYLNISNVILLIISQPFGWIYYIDSNNIYHRGPFYVLTIFVNILLIVGAFILILKNKKKIDKRHYFSLQFFSVPPLIGMTLQALSFNIPVTLNSLVLSIFLVFLTIQRNSMNTDYLTGVSNRSNFEMALQNKIYKSTKDKTFSGIMIDINNFKSINDTFGHDMGDHALRATAKILVGCIRSNDLLSRYGGDEFCVILDIYDRDKLESIVKRINNCVDFYNEYSGKPFKLKFSMGYDVYDFNSKMTSEQFKRHIDELMYKNKPYNIDKEHLSTSSYI